VLETARGYLRRGRSDALTAKGARRTIVEVLRKDAKIDLIKHVPLFERCSKRELNQIASIADEIEVPADWNLTKEGGTGAEFIVLVNGTADVRRSGRKINTLRNGDFLGEISLVTGKPRTATVTTTEPTRLLVITARDFQTLMSDSPTTQAKVLQAVVSRLPED
jgi:CRP/FNR family transcriptional regulator, cyclic AMP receptor protein